MFDLNWTQGKHCQRCFSRFIYYYTLFSNSHCKFFKSFYEKSFFPLDLPDNTEGNDQASESEIDDIFALNELFTKDDDFCEDFRDENQNWALLWEFNRE